MVVGNMHLMTNSKVLLMRLQSVVVFSYQSFNIPDCVGELRNHVQSFLHWLHVVICWDI